MLRAILDKGIPFGLLLALVHTLIKAWRTGFLKFKFNALEFVTISLVAGVTMGLIIGWIEQRKGKP